jgi:aspartate racemase
MKTIGLIGGLSWESSIEYYRIINETVKETLGGLHSAKSIMSSFDFHEIETLQHQGEWDKAAELMIAAAQSLERAGADFIIICSNTMHRMADEVQRAIKIPLLHIADATAEKIVAQGIKKVGLLATGFTMEQEFYKGRLTQKYGLEVLVPPKDERQVIHDVIYNELCLGIVKPESREAYRKSIETLVANGAEAIILGCTEIMLLVKPEDSSVPQFDTTAIHAKSAVEYAIGVIESRNN